MGEREESLYDRPLSPISFQLFCANACGFSGQLNSRLLPGCLDWDIFYDDAWTPSTNAIKKSFSFQPRDYYRCKPSIGWGERKGVKSMRNRRCWLTKATNANAMEMYSADKSADQRFCNKLRIGFLMNRGSNANRTDESADFGGYDKGNGFCRMKALVKAFCSQIFAIQPVNRHLTQPFESHNLKLPARLT